MADWIKHDGKGMPVDGETLVQVKFPDGWTDEKDPPRKAKDWFWGWGEEEPRVLEIIAYRVHTPSSEVSA